jgi:hypothetical protein
VTGYRPPTKDFTVPFIATHIKWIMLAAGVLTCTMILAAIAPQAVFLSNFGETLSGPGAVLVVRNWGVLIALVGAMLVYGAFNRRCDAWSPRWPWSAS